MYVIQVLPLIKGTRLDTLTYFSAISYEIGTFLKVPVRNRNCTGIVVESKNVSQMKSSVRGASFKLRKLPTQKSAAKVSDTLSKTAHLVASKYPVSAGAILFQLLPPDIRNGLEDYPVTESQFHQEDTAPQILTGRIDDRFLAYQSHIRSTFARDGSVLLVVPTSIDAVYVAREFAHGIEDRLILVHGAQTKKDRAKARKELMDNSTSKLIITTPTYAYFNRSDVKTIIVEQSGSSYYTDRTTPYLDHREVLKTYAKVGGRSILLGDTLPLTEDEVRRRQDKYFTYGEEVKRLVFPAPLTTILQNDKPQTEKPFALFSPELRRSVELTLESNGIALLYSSRRGLAPIVACVDCGHIFRCPDSNTPYSLLRTVKNNEEKRWFVSSTSGKKVRAADVCPHCGSWRLKERGIGIQHVYDEWKELYPDHSVFLVDSETAPTPTKARKLIEQLYEQKSGVLIATQMVFPYLYKGVDMSAVISVDAARTVPTWRADESFFRLLLRLRELSVREVLLQTRNQPDQLIEYAKRGAVEKFYDEEIGVRQLAKYPPFVDFILLTWSGSAEVIKKADELISKTLDSLPKEEYYSPHSTSQKQVKHALVRVSKDDTVAYAKTLEIIKKLPPFVKVEINPDRIV